jgi:hypothetical protein
VDGRASVAGRARPGWLARLGKEPEAEIDQCPAGPLPQREGLRPPHAQGLARIGGTAVVVAARRCLSQLDLALAR